MLSASDLQVKGRRTDLLRATTLDVQRGQLLLAYGNNQEERTALALTLSGRMKPSNGTAQWDGHPKIKALRLASALVDSPTINEPEQHLSVRDLVTEDLALIPRRYRGALLSKPWLKINRFEDIESLWVEQLAPARRLELLTALALANPATDLLIVDSPDRHSAHPADWLPRLEQLAYDAGRPLAIVATVSAVPSTWDGPSVEIGNAAETEPNLEPEAEAPSEHPAESAASDEAPTDVPAEAQATAATEPPHHGKHADESTRTQALEEL
ncbi:ABC transporter ATP-binding protein [Pseudarthrobacter sp. J1738]|uniref:ABC transporter ATP-binding protein n=1 Tax=Pseudarthrobacter sp. J1738 TaxID=3420446 RepID=UPI003D28DA38